MSSLAIGLASLASATIGAFLLALALLVRRFGQDRGARLFLVAYLALVGAEYLLGGLNRVVVRDASGLHLAGVLVGVAVWVWVGALGVGPWRRGEEGGGFLAVYLGAAGAFQALWSLNAASEILGGPLPGVPTLRGLGLFEVSPSVLDPLPLLLFALAAGGRRVDARRIALAAAPILLLVAIVLLAYPSEKEQRLPDMPPGQMAERLSFVAVLGICYGSAFLLLARAWLKEEDPAREARLGALVVLLGLVVLPRLCLVHADLGFVTRPGPPLYPHAIAFLVGGLALLFGLAWLWMTRAARPEARPRVRRTLRGLGALLALVATGWALGVVPGWEEFAYALLYSGRWLVFAGALTLMVRRHGLLDLPPRTAGRARGVLAAVAAALLLVQLAILLETLQGSPLAVRILDSVMLVGLCGVAYAAFRVAVPPEEGEVAWQRLRVYRAHAELGVSEEELEAHRARLGIGEDEAREIRRLVALERQAPAAARSGDAPAEGALFLGRYEVESLLGAGAFGRAWAARDRVGGARVVLKELAPAWREDEEALARFEREARTAMRVAHPNLVAFHALERGRNGRVLVLERVEGETLRERLERGPLSPAEAARMAADVLAGLEALHRAGIVHRDVKPDNVMLRPDGRAVLLDFGAVADASARGGTRPSAARDEAPSHPGTPAYMSPEQARGDPVGPPSDLWAVGVVLREALAGAPPPAWRAALAKALEPDPARRWGDAGEMRRALKGA